MTAMVILGLLFCGAVTLLVIGLLRRRDAATEATDPGRSVGAIDDPDIGLMTVFGALDGENGLESPLGGVSCAWLEVKLSATVTTGGGADGSRVRSRTVPLVTYRSADAVTLSDASGRAEITLARSGGDTVAETRRSYVPSDFPSKLMARLAADFGGSGRIPQRATRLFYVERPIAAGAQVHARGRTTAPGGPGPVTLRDARISITGTHSFGRRDAADGRFLVVFGAVTAAILGYLFLSKLL